MVARGAMAHATAMTTQATTPLPEPPEAPSSRRLTRSSGDRVIAGVAGGLGRYFSIDPVVVRIAFIVGAFFGGAGLIAYGAAWLLVPSDNGASRGSDAAGVARRLGIGLGMLVLTGVAVIAGFAGAASGGATTVAIVVIAAGGLLMLGAFTGGMRWLIVPALALGLAAGAAAAGNIDIRGGTGERIYRPATADTLRSDYRLGVGHLLLDLRNTKLGPGEHHVHLKLGLGQAEVLVPANVCVSSTAHIAGGGTTIFDHTSGGTYHDWQETQRAKPGASHLTVDADIGFGELRIEPGVGVTGTQEGACING
jgi:phage shock protein PspC (stress-responsive transcriptional regulator)